MSTLCVQNQTFTFTLTVGDQANPGLWKVAATIAAGDFQRSTNGQAMTNLDNLPTVTPAGGRIIQIVLSAAETAAAGAGGLITVVGVDAADDEWFDAMTEIRVSATDVDTYAADVWAYGARTLTQSATAIAAVVAGDAITALRGDTLVAALTGLGDISARTKLWFTVKKHRNDDDSEAIAQIEETAGLLILNQADASARSGNGSITVNDEILGNITIRLEAIEMDDLDPANRLYYDVQMATASDVSTLREGTFNVSPDVTRAVS